MEYGIRCSPAQMRKLKSGGAVTLTSSNFDEDAPHRMMVMPATSRRIQTAMRKKKGVRVALKPEEDLVAMTEGGKVSLKGISRGISKGVSKGADVVKRGFNKTIVDSGVGKHIARELIDVGTKYVLPEGLSALSMLAGDPTGMSGQILGDMAGERLDRYAERKGYGVKQRTRKALINQINALKKRLVKAQKLEPVKDYYFTIEAAMKETEEGADMDEVSIGRFTNDGLMEVIENLTNMLQEEGSGLFKTIKKVTGINKKAIVSVAKDVGKTAVRVGAKAAGEAITAYTGNPALGNALERVAVSSADRAIDSKSGKDILRNAGRGAKSQAKMIAVEGIDDYIDKNLSGAERDVAQKALAGKYPSAADLVYDYGNSKIEEMSLGKQQMMGYGVPRRTRGGMRTLSMGGKMGFHRMPDGSMMTNSMMMSGGAISSGFEVADDREVTPATAPSSVIQTGSPFQRYSSPAMSPFISGSPQLVGQGMKPRMGMGHCGGSFLPAGYRSGGSFVPAGV